MYINVHTICDVNSVYVVKTRDLEGFVGQRKECERKERERKIVGRFWDLLLSDITPYKE